MKKNLIIAILVTSSLGLFIDLVIYSLEPSIDFTRGLALFRYYTIQTNTLVWIYFLMLALGKIQSGKLQKLLGGISIYIAITFLVFAVMLQATYHPQGIYIISNLCNHYLTPILTITFFIYSLKDKAVVYENKDVFLWIIYPLLYVIFMILYGSLTNDYLYPFFQLPDIGLKALIITILLLVVLFFILSFSVVKIVSFVQKKNSL